MNASGLALPADATRRPPGRAAAVPEVQRRLRRAWGRGWQWIAIGVLTVLLTAPAAAQAPQPPEPIAPAALLESARKDMEALRTAQDRALDDAAISALRKQALSVQTRAGEAAAAMAPELADLQARLVGLGKPEEGVKESPDVASERAQLMKSVSTLDSQIKLARLVAVEAEQVAASASANARTQFSAKLEEHTPSVLGSEFWRTLKAGAPEDLRRLRRVGADLRGAIDAVQPRVWAVVLAVVAVLLLVRWGLQRVLLHVNTTRVPSGRLRRSLHALGVTLVWMLTPGLIAHAMRVGLNASGGVTAPLAELLLSAEAIVWFGGFVAGLGSSLLMSRRSSWRLPPISDATAIRLRHFPEAFAVALVLGWVTQRLASTMEASVTATAAGNGLAALTFVVILGLALRQVRHAKRDRDAAHAEDTGAGSDEPAARAPVPLWLSTLRTLAVALLIVSSLALLSGYVALGHFLVYQLVWALIVVSTAYLLSTLVDDLFMTLLAPTARPEATGLQAEAQAHAAADTRHPPPGPRTREQTAVLLSGLCRTVIGFFALLLLLAPYGEGPLDLLRRAGQLDEGLSIGEISVRPAALLQGVLVLLVGLFAVRLLKDWLGNRVMPTTRMDAGMRMSVTTLFGYVGAVVVIALAMSAVGVGLERVAWVASALSVGIGFGLQAVVQNFVSGLILLAERPVKVGDWVSLAGVEGDIRRINVRATEIQMGDRSTVIVPNSEFITKIVRNVTYTDPLGMVQFKLPMPLTTDTRKAREVLMAAFVAHPGILTSPAPNVQLDGIDSGNLVFNASGYVHSPRASYGVRSDLLFDVLERLREADLSLGKPPTILVSDPALLGTGAVHAAGGGAPVTTGTTSPVPPGV